MKTVVFNKKPVGKQKRAPIKWATTFPLNLWARCIYDRCSKNALALLERDDANISVPANSTCFVGVELLAKNASVPIPIESLSEELKDIALPRSRGYFGPLGKCLDQIACNYPHMHWWVTDKGLNMQRVEPSRPALSEFDEFAGKMTEQNWQNAHLSDEALLTIASALDEKGFSLKDDLQPAQRKAITSFNQSNSRRNPIRNFGQAVRNPQFVRYVRRRLYVARNRFNDANARMKKMGNL